MTTREPFRPTPAHPGYDPAQLSFGDISAVPQLRVERLAGEGGAVIDELAAMTFREPPVCGEYTYDDLDDAGPSWSVRIVQEVAPASTPAAPITATTRSAPPRPAAAAPIAPSAPGASSAPPAAATARPVPTPRTPARTSRPVSLPPAMTAPLRPTPIAVPSASLDPLKRSTELSPRDADAAIAYANALDKQGNAGGALAALDACLAQGGDEVRLICARAFLLGSRLKYDLAEQELKRAGKLRADDADVMLQHGILACRRARWKDAVEPLMKAAAQRSDDAHAQYFLGEALNHVDQLPLALAAYERAAQLDASNWRAWKGVGIVLDRMGRPTDAAAAYRHMREAQGR